MITVAKRNVTGNLPGWSGSADAKERFAEQYLTSQLIKRNNIQGVQPAWYGGMTPTQRTEYWNTLRGGNPLNVDEVDLNNNVPGPTTTVRTSASSSRPAGAMTAQQKLDEQIRQQRIRAMQGFLGGGGPEQSLAGLRGSLNNMIAAGEGDVEGVYGRTMGNIASGYGAAENLTRQGYDQLSAFLSANPNNPYSGFSAEAGAVSNPMEQVLGAYGVDAPEAQAMLQAEMAAGQSGASNFNALVDVLSRSAQLGATSRASEMEMARNFATTSLGQQRASYESQAAGARQQALAQLAQMRAQREFEIQQSVDAIRQRIVEELLGIGGNPVQGGNQGGSQGGSQGGASSFVPQAGDNQRVMRYE